MRGSVRTVLGDIAPDRLGHVQMHEHMVIDLWKGVPASASDADAPRYLEPLRLNNYYWSRRHHSRDDLRLTDAAVAIEELTAYRDAGGGTIVDVTSVGLGRDPTALAEISRATGVHIVMGCGYYYVDYHPRELAAADLDSVTEEIVRDLTAGVGDTGIRAGIIGEIGMSWPPAPAELVVLEAAAQAHLATGVTISVHPGRDPNSPSDVLRGWSGTVCRRRPSSWVTSSAPSRRDRQYSTSPPAAASSNSTSSARSPATTLRARGLHTERCSPRRLHSRSDLAWPPGPGAHCTGHLSQDKPRPVRRRGFHARS